jgi:ABC-type nickel/cobalt efflux system permease component RcnA
MNFRTRLTFVAALMMALAFPGRAAAHPMGNFSINHYSGVQVARDQIEIRYIIDMAEIPTFQAIRESGIVPRVADASLSSYMSRESRLLREGLDLRINGRRLTLQELDHQIIFPPGAGGLPTMKMGFRFIAKAPISTIGNKIDYRDDNFPEHAGWKEIIAVAQPGIEIATSSVSAQDRSAELSTYPTDLLNSPPQTLAAQLTFRPTVAGTRSTAMTGGGSGAPRPAVALHANVQGTPRNAFTQLIETQRSDVLFLLIATLIAATLGGFHALEPGHGKTLVAAYLVGSHGTARHAVLLGAVVTGSHTISVYVLGIITLYTSQWIVPERLYPWLGIFSGLLVAGLGFTLFMQRFVSKKAPNSSAGQHQREHTHDRGSHKHIHENDSSAFVHHHTWWGGHLNDVHAYSDRKSQGHEHEELIHMHSYSHVDGHPRHHPEAITGKGISLKSLFALGVTGGIVPCPAALVVLLGALAIHRVAFGLFLIVAFSIGLASVLIGFGLAMVYARRLVSRFRTRGPLTERWLPLASSAVITVIGATITIQSLISAGIIRAGL